MGRCGWGDEGLKFRHVKFERPIGHSGGDDW